MPSGTPERAVRTTAATLAAEDAGALTAGLGALDSNVLGLHVVWTPSRAEQGMVKFVGRGRELRALQAELDACRDTGEGRLMMIRGRRQVGKSALVEHWLEAYDGPSVFFEAHGYTETRELARFRDALTSSSLPSAVQGRGVTFGDWQAALTTAAADASRERPSVIVLDEFPDLCEKGRDADGNPAPSPQEGGIRAAWRTLQKLPFIVSDRLRPRDDDATHHLRFPPLPAPDAPNDRRATIASRGLADHGPHGGCRDRLLPGDRRVPEDREPVAQRIARDVSAHRARRPLLGIRRGGRPHPGWRAADGGGSADDPVGDRCR